jgi:hypothetical protein
MKVTVKYFASIREAIGLPAEVVQTRASNLKALRDELIARGGACPGAGAWQGGARLPESGDERGSRYSARRLRSGFLSPGHGRLGP